jgi:HEAT repeat protein
MSGDVSLNPLNPDQLLQQAELAAQQGDWPRLNQVLSQVLSGDGSSVLINHLSPKERESYLELALQLLRWGDFQDCWELTSVFSAFGSIAIVPLLSLLQDNTAEWETHWSVIRILGALNHPDVVAPLIQMLAEVGPDSGDDEIGSVLMEALVHLGSLTIAPLQELLNDAKTRFAAVQVLAHIRSVATIEPLMSVVQDADERIRVIAVEALSSFHEPQIPLVLVQALRDPTASVRQAAIAGLGFRSDLSASFNLVQHLTVGLSDPVLEVCRQAAIALGRLGNDDAIFALANHLQIPNLPVILQTEIVRTLGWVDTATALETLRQILNTSQTISLSSTSIQEILSALGRTTTPQRQVQAAQILLQLLQMQHPCLIVPEHRQQIALSLGQLGYAPSLDALVQLLADPEPSVRLHVVAALKQLAPQQAYQTLKTLSQTPLLPAALQAGIQAALQEWTFAPRSNPII